MGINQVGDWSVGDNGGSNIVRVLCLVHAWQKLVSNSLHGREDLFNAGKEEYMGDSSFSSWENFRIGEKV